MTQRDFVYKDNWERMRLQTYITIQPYANKGLTAEKLLPLPWDKKPAKNEKIPERTAAEQRARTAELMERMKKLNK